MPLRPNLSEKKEETQMRFCLDFPEHAKTRSMGEFCGEG